MKKCYIKNCNFKANSNLNPHIKQGPVYTNKNGLPSCWLHQRGYYLGEFKQDTGKQVDVYVDHNGLLTI